MLSNRQSNLKLLIYMMVALVGLWFTINLISFPNEALQAALKGFAIWWDVLFPALFPFLVIAEIMLGFGIVHFIGTLLDPMMRPVFRVPGIGGFVMAMGFASGYPVGSKLTAQVYGQKLIDREEGERLIAFTTTSDPIFLIGAVSIGFFHNPGLALLLAVAHYGSAVVVGIIMRYHGLQAMRIKSQQKFHTLANVQISSKKRVNIWLAAFNAMHEARLKDHRNLGQLLQDAVRSSLSLMFVIGGLVVFFSVFMEMMQTAGLLSFMHEAATFTLSLFNISPELSQAIISGLFEVTIGAQAAGEASSLLRHNAAVASFVLAWGGLSVHAQVLSLISKTSMRYTPFLFGRLIHAVLAALTSFLAWPWLQPLTQSKAWLPAFQYTNPIQAASISLQLSAVLILLVFVLILVCFAIYKLGKALRRWRAH